MARAGEPLRRPGPHPWAHLAWQRKGGAQGHIVRLAEGEENLATWDPHLGVPLVLHGNEV